MALDGPWILERQRRELVAGEEVELDLGIFLWQWQRQFWRLWKSKTP